MTTRKQTSQIGIIKFSIDKVIANINSSDVSYLELGDELKNINNDKTQNFNNLVTATPLAEDQQIKTETDNLNDKTQIMDMDE